MEILKNILVINPGSSSLKWSWFSSSSEYEANKSGLTELEHFNQWLYSLSDRVSVDYVIIRFVHGGGQYSEPIELSLSKLNQLEAFNEFAPLHNPISIFCAKQILQVLADQAEIYAAFDCEFFRHLPLVSKTYAIPEEIIKKYSIKRYGFHGFAHAGMYSSWQEAITERRKAGSMESRVITIQLGAGCSMSAIKNGEPIDTSMGFTPNEGLVMATRSGDIDPGLVTWLQRKEDWSPEKTEEVLNQNSGWLGLSGLSKNFAELLASDNPQARLAVDLFCWRIRKSIGAYYAILGGLDGIILSGGLAENAPNFCRELLNDLNHLGVEIQSDKIFNNNITSNSVQLSTHTAPVGCWIVKNSEAQAMIASVANSINKQTM